MQRRHSVKHLLWRGGVAAVSDVAMVTGLYPLLPHAVSRTSVRAALREWGIALAASAIRPAGFFPLPGARTQGPRPIVVVHGYAMNRTSFVPLAYRMSRAGLGPIFGFEYWSLGRTAAAARQLGWFLDHVRAATGAGDVDVVAHSMGGVVSNYYVRLLGCDGIVRRLITIGSPHAGTAFSRLGVGHPMRELVTGSRLVQRLAAAREPARTRVTTIWSHEDALVPAKLQADVAGAERILFEGLGHMSLLASKRVAEAVIERLAARD